MFNTRWQQWESKQGPLDYGTRSLSTSHADHLSWRQYIILLDITFSYMTSSQCFFVIIELYKSRAIYKWSASWSIRCLQWYAPVKINHLYVSSFLCIYVIRCCRKTISGKATTCSCIILYNICHINLYICWNKTLILIWLIYILYNYNILHCFSYRPIWAAILAYLKIR